MLATYRAVFRAPGSAAFAAACFVMRVPIALYPIALVLAVSARDGRYGFAGEVSAAYIVGGAPGLPVLGRLVDRFGQRAVLIPSTVAHAAAVVTLALLLKSGAPDWTLLIPAFVSGFAYLSPGSLVRARWSLVLAGRPELSTAYSLESTLDEVVFVVGPLVATLIATAVDPVLVFAVAVALVVLGAAWLFPQRATEPPRRPSGAPPHRSALRHRGMPMLTAVAIALGMIFASAELSMIAFAGQHHERPLTGLVLAMFAAGSGTAGFVYGTVAWRRSLRDRFRLNALGFGLLTALFLVAWNLVSLMAVAFVVGMTIAPTLITAFGLIDRIVAPAALTEGLSWLSTGLNIGYGAGAAIVGGIADAHGARSAFLVTVTAGLATICLASLLHRQLRSDAPDAPVSAPGTADPGPSAAAMAPSKRAALP